MASAEYTDPSLPAGLEGSEVAKSSVRSQQHDTRIQIMATMASADEAQLLRWLAGLQCQPDRIRILQMPQKLAARIGLPNNWLQCTVEEQGTLLRNCCKPLVFIPHGASRTD